MVLFRSLSFRSTLRTGGVPAIALALGVALPTGFLLSPPTFRTTAVVGVDDIVSRPHADALRFASELAVSRPVLLRTATRLIDNNAVLPAPTLLERLGVLAPVNSAGSRAARLADQLHAVVRSQAGAGGVLDISADAAQPAQASRIATAMAEALIMQRDMIIADTKRAGETATASRLSALRDGAASAHRRLTSLAGTDIDLAQALATATERVIASEARVASLRSIVASGSPPLADSRDPPQSVEALQTAYLDLTRKLAVASETLGERHTTIIALQDGIRRASAALTGEWKRLLRVAEADLAGARQRAASIGKADTAPDAAHQAAIDEARRVARNADDAVARAEAQGALAVDDQPYRLISPAPVPVVPTAGWSLLMRIIGSVLAGFGAFGIAGLALAQRGATQPDSKSIASEVTGTAFEPGSGASLPSGGRHTSEPLAPRLSAVENIAMLDLAAADMQAETPSFFDSEPDPFVAKEKCMPPLSPHVHPDADLTLELESAFGDIVDDLVMISPEASTVPTIMVAANEISGGTMAVALSVARVAVERGMRVLLVEGPRQRPELAGVAGPDCEPMLGDLFGNLRVVLQAEHADALFVAPFLKNGANIAAALARNTQAPFLDDLASEFDIIIIDGCRAADSAAAGLKADRYVRVGRFASRRETERYIKALDITPEAFVGTVAGSTFVPPPSDRDAWRPAVPQAVEISQARAASTSKRVPSQGVPVATRPAYPRRVASR